MAYPIGTSSGQVSPPLDLDLIDRAMTFTSSECCTISCGTVCVDPRTSKVLIIFNSRLGIWQLPKGRKNIGEDLHVAALRETYEETGVFADLFPLKIQTRSTNPLDKSKFAPGPAREVYDAVFHRATQLTSTASSASTEYGISAASMASSTVTPGFGVSAAGPEEHLRDIYTMSEQFTNAPGKRQINGRSHAVDYAGNKATLDPKLISDMFNNELVGIVQYPDLQAATPNTIKTVFFFAALADSTTPMGLGAQEEHEDLQAEWVSFDIASQRLRFGSEKEALWKVESDLKRSDIKC